jgi:hypothetical protein
MDSKLSRTPPIGIRRKLRKEVGFGCPVEGCGSPYLSWHHFDPPWNTHPHHNLEGMVALCLQHHKEADHGAFTIQQLRNMKEHPYLKELGKFPKGRFNWKREQLLLLAGGNWYINFQVILRLKGKNIIWLSKDKNGFEQLNLDIYDLQENIILKMRDNDWLVYTSFDDLECPPSANSLRLEVESNNIWIDLRFSQLSKTKLYREIESLLRRACQDIKKQIEKTWPENDWIEKILDSIEFKKEQAREKFESICKSIKGENVTLCTLEGHFIWPLEISLSKTHTIFGHNILAGNLLVNGGVGVEIA